MASIEEIREARLEKLKKLREKGVNPFPVSSASEYTLAEVALDFSKLEKKKSITLAGRIMAMRGQGAIIFCDLNDGTGTFQALLKKDAMKLEDYELWRETVDIGDFVEVSGTLFVTKRNEKTLQVSKWRILAKSLRQLPEKWHGLQDVEERFRKRYLDILMNEGVRSRFLSRSKIVAVLRGELAKDDFLEVETSILQPLAGGANAEPFKTRHNALDMDLYLRIAPELDLKKLIISGYPRVYEIGRSFRNEGIDVTHNPEFTTVEWYTAYSDALREQKRVEKYIKAVAEAIKGEEKVSFDGKEIDFSKPFAKASYFELLERYALLTNPAGSSIREVKLKAEQLGIKTDNSETKEKLLDAIYKKTVRPKLIQPTFIVDYPKNYIPLAKQRDDNREIVDAFQVVIGGIELVKAFSELNDPVEQRERFASQAKNKELGDAEAHPSDEAFLEALEYGMPPAGGVGLSIDRLTMILTDAKNIREVIFFPTLRPRT